MSSVDFEFCKFIDKELSFVTFLDFYRNRKIIKFFYENIDNDAKLFYKWYVYANIFINEYGKNAIWEYLNDNEEEYEQNLTEIANKFK